MDDFNEQLQNHLDCLEQRALLRRRQVRSDAMFPNISINGKNLINFAANDYLGLAADRRVIQALADGANKWGVGAGAAHLLSGHTKAHHDFEIALAEFLGFESALLFSTGYMANLGIISAFASRNDTVIEDKLNHASLLDGAALSRAKLMRYKHNDPEDARKKLQSAQGRKLLITDGVFSMDGRIAGLVQLNKIAQQENAQLIVDDAHGFGTVGKSGRGSLEHCGLKPSAVMAQIVTLGKALGVFGAAVVGSKLVIENLVQAARPWIFTTAMPPALSEAQLVALNILQNQQWRRDKLNEYIQIFRQAGQKNGWQLCESITPIQPVIVGSSENALGLSHKLSEQGFYVPAVRPPTVPEGTARLRVTFSAAHTKEQVNALINALKNSLSCED